MEYTPKDFRVQAITPQVSLGKTYADKLTGFKGVAVARTEYIDQAPAVALQGKSIDGKPPETQWFVEHRLIGATA